MKLRSGTATRQVGSAQHRKCSKAKPSLQPELQKRSEPKVQPTQNSKQPEAKPSLQPELQKRSEPEVQLAQNRKQPEAKPSLQPGSHKPLGAPARPDLRRAPLTRHNLLEHTKATTPMTAHKRTATKTSKTTRTTDNRFPKKLRENGIHFGPVEPEPSDLAELRDYLDRRRASGSPDLEEWRQYCVQTKFCENEATYVHNGFAMLRKPRRVTVDMPYITTFDHKWSEAEDCPLAAGLSEPKPDLAESYALEVFPTQMTYDLGYALQPSADYEFSLPRFVAELKSPKGDMHRAGAQAAYDGAIMTEGAMQQQEYLGRAKQFSKTQALTVTANGAQSYVQAHYAVQSPAGTQYHMFGVFDDSPLMSRESYSQARKHVRNAQDWAYDQSTKALQDLRNRQPDQALIPIPPSLHRPVSSGEPKGGPGELKEGLGQSEGGSDESTSPLDTPESV